MKKFILFICATVLATALASAQAQKIVTVSMAELFDGYYKTTKFREQTQGVQQQVQGELRAKQEELQTMATQAETLQEELQNPVLSDSAKAEKQTQLQQLAMQFQQKQQEVEQWRQETLRNLQNQNMAKRNQFLGEIRDVVISVAKDEGASMVLDTSDIANTGVPAVIYSDTQLDITAKVERLLNKDQGAAAGPAAK
ncbi:MAG: OmpH family outer membrane protein [Verrucomicrobiota bacterium JB022]|nr:OmpH family outer membrane protein [Verrucomicrobiota bacterium JB022]